MEKARAAGKSPIPVQVEAGKSYAWCACGNSAKQPFCDGSHKGSQFAPKVFVAEVTKTVFLCNCKQTSTPPFCDGTHKAV